MSTIILWGLVSLALCLASVTALLLGIKRKSLNWVYMAIIFFFFLTLSGAYTCYLLVQKVYHKTKVKKLPIPFEARSGYQIYTAIFGAPEDSCVVVTNQMDQTIPRLDCCIWLKFRTCPEELKRVLLKGKFQKVPDSTKSVSPPDYSPRPEWFKPSVLGKEVFVYEVFSPENPNRHQIIYFSQDSSSAMYCDMAD